MNFGIDGKALLAVGATAALWMLLSLWFRRTARPVIPVPTLRLLVHARAGARQSAVSLPRLLMIVALLFFCAAVLNPRIYQKKKGDNPSNRAPAATEGIALYFALDQSGSMEGKAIVSSESGRVPLTKLDLLKQVTRSFIEGDPRLGLSGRPNDMIGLVAFARTAQVLAPLTLDHRILLDQLKDLGIMRIKDQDGTGIGYAIYKTANLIAATRHFAENLRGKGKPAYEIKDAVIVLVTDGMQDPNPLDLDNRYRWMDPEQAAAFAKKENIRLYVVNINPEFTKPEWEANRKQMRRVAESTGGKFYVLDTTSSIADIYKEIDTLAKSSLPVSSEAIVSKAERPEEYRTVWLYPYLVAMGMLFLAVAALLQTTWLRRVP